MTTADCPTTTEGCGCVPPFAVEKISCRLPRSDEWLASQPSAELDAAMKKAAGELLADLAKQLPPAGWIEQ